VSNKKLNKTWVDQYIVFAVLIQPVLMMLQIILLHIYKISPELATNYRVSLTILFLVPALVLSLYRRPVLFFVVYSIALIIILLNLLIFPENSEILSYNTQRFLFPVCIGSALCLMSVKDLEIFNKMLYVTSWIIFGQICIYIYAYLSGSFMIDTYNMSLGYALLLPMYSLYSHKRWYTYLVALIFLIVIALFGSRGPMVAFFIYVIADTILYNRRLLIPIVICGTLAIVFFTQIYEIVNALGIKSRSIEFLMSGDFISNDSGRDGIYQHAWEYIKDNMVFGQGLCSDMRLLGTYVHNFFYEIFFHWGLILGGAILLLLVGRWVKIYLHVTFKGKEYLIGYSIILFTQALVSSSYIINYNLAFLVGVCYLIGKTYHKNAKNSNIIGVNDTSHSCEN